MMRRTRVGFGGSPGCTCAVSLGLRRYISGINVGINSVVDVIGVFIVR
jgi:hypothetical protein